MIFEDYMEAVKEAEKTGIYPADPRVPLALPFTNDAGIIQNIAIGDFQTATVIVSKNGSIRSNHYHKTDSHFIYVLEGCVYYYWRKVGERFKTEEQHFYPGQIFFTPPLVEHATYFPRDTTLFVVSRYARDHKSHEADVIRIKLIEKNEDGQIKIVPR